LTGSNGRPQLRGAGDVQREGGRPMTKAGVQLTVVICATLIGCGSASPSATHAGAANADAEEACVGRREIEGQVDPFLPFCSTQGADPALAKRMTETIVAAGVELRHFSLQCRADICKVKCETSPREACVDELQRVTQWSAHHQLFDAIEHSSRRGYSLYKFLSKDYLAALPARRAALDRIARRFHASPALAQCKQSTTVHGQQLLYIDVPVSGTPSVMVDGEVAMTPDADCVSKALLAAVIEEQVAPPLANDDLPFAVVL
jgi:hypothetical protein